jgi:hypothetical protein
MTDIFDLFIFYLLTIAAIRVNYQNGLETGFSTLAFFTALTNLGALFLISVLTILLHAEKSIGAQEGIHFS